MFLLLNWVSRVCEAPVSHIKVIDRLQVAVAAVGLAVQPDYTASFGGLSTQVRSPHNVSSLYSHT